tara:strand:- start:80 stop:1144 length:1065 start_codon:yes stop_codon:yes gene_type:complete
MKKLVVVSLYDGISIAMSSLNRLGIYPTKYYASEIDPYAISISKYNFPEIIRLTDVTKITGNEIKEPVDLLIGGSPCNGFSFAGKMLQFNDPNSKLFFEYVRLLKILKPKYFLFENVKMPTKSSQVISEMLNFDFKQLNSNLLSAQNRSRLYWSNLKIKMPKPQGLLLKDIIQDGEVNYNYTNEPNFMERYNNKASDISASPQVLMNVKKNFFKIPDKFYLSRKMKNYILADKFGNKGKINLNPKVAKTLTASYFKMQRSNVANYISAGYAPEGKTNIRRVTPTEAERLQTLPDNYTALGIDKNGKQVSISDSRRYYVLGNGFTSDIISWILSPLLKENPDMNNKHSLQLKLFK